MTDLRIFIRCCQSGENTENIRDGVVVVASNYCCEGSLEVEQLRWGSGAGTTWSLSPAYAPGKEESLSDQQMGVGGPG